MVSMSKKSVALILIFFMIASIAATAIPITTVQASKHVSAGTILKYGANNNDVWDLQYRLQILGFYNASVDGKFGRQTETAVRQFQQKYGLTVDGIVGPVTWKALKRVSVNAYEMKMLARVVYGEARGEPYVGQVAVAAVVMNRLKSPQFPDTIAGVIFQPRAFTAVDDGQYWLEPDATAYAAARDAVRGWDPTGGALYYFNPKTATSKWIWSRKQITTIGNHTFAI